MSRLDKQLDEISGERLVIVSWPMGEEVDIDDLRRQLIREIDEHRERVPLDLRRVDGAPEPLVELLHDMRRYAVTKSKVLSPSRILPPLRDALERRQRRPFGKSVAPSAAPDLEQTSDLATEILKETLGKDYDVSKAEKIERKTTKKKPTAGTDRYRYWKLAGVVLAATLVIGGVEAYIIFQQPDDVFIPEITLEEND